ncbi:MAG: hypothetical protein HZB71_07105 [Betaproteobacteria bacterium]|nr:hypothetical protein [Betaproteobacteria bacterium]
MRNLPLSNPAEAAEELADFLAGLNQTELSHDQRLAVVEKVGAVVEDIVVALYEQYSVAALPLQPKQQRNAQAAQRLLMEMAGVYKILTLDWLQRRFHLFGGNPVPLYLQRILLTLQAAVEISFETHEVLPKGIWADLHQTYNYALRTGQKDVMPSGSEKMQSLEQIYKATLLMALADPYHFPQVELPWIKDVIARFSNLVSIFPAEESSKGQAGLFVVDINTDYPPRPIAQESHAMNPRWDLLLNTTELAKHLALITNHLNNPKDLDKLGLPDAAQDPAYAPMVRRLKQHWGAAAQRQSQRRRHQDGKEVEVCFGLKTLHHLIGEASQDLMADLPGSEPGHQIVRCKTLNDSMGGLALGKNSAIGIQIRIGEAAGVRQANGSWGIGVVRWFRVPKSGTVYFGVQFLAPGALPVEAKRLDTGKHWPVLMLAPAPTGKPPSMLLSLPGCFAPENQLEIRSDKGRHQLRLESRMDSTPHLEQYRFQITGAV